MLLQNASRTFYQWHLCPSFLLRLCCAVEQHAVTAVRVLFCSRRRQRRTVNVTRTWSPASSIMSGLQMCAGAETTFACLSMSSETALRRPSNLEGFDTTQACGTNCFAAIRSARAPLHFLVCAAHATTSPSIRETHRNAAASRLT